MSLHAVLVQLVKDLKACPSIEVEAAKLGREKTALAAKNAHKNTIGDFDISLEVVRFSPVEPIFLRYTAQLDGFRPIGGEFRLTPVTSTLHHSKGNGLAWDGITPEERALVEHLKIFDSHPRAGDYLLAAFYMPPFPKKPRPMPDIYFFDRGKTFKMCLDYGGYIQAMANCAAVGGWQYLYLTEPPADPDVLGSLREKLNCLQKLLPQRDWSAFSGRLDALGG